MSNQALRRPAWPRVAAVAVAIALAAALLPSTLVSAAGHREIPMLSVQPSDEIDVAPMFVDGAAFGFGDRGDQLFVYNGPGDPSLGFELFVVDACASSGSGWLLGHNDTGSLIDVDLTFPGVSATTIQLPGTPFVSRIGIPCQQLHPARTSTLPRLIGVATYQALGRGCTSFDVPVELVESRAGRGLTTYTMRDQRNRIVHTNPLVAVDGSKLFDEVHVLTLADPTDPTSIEGIAIGGPQGILPKGKKLQRLIDQAWADQSQDLAESLLERARSGKPPKALLEKLNVKGNPCTYAIEVDVKGTTEDDVLHAVQDTLTLPGSPLATDPRFEVALMFEDGPAVDLAPVPVFGEPGSADASDLDFWFFDPANSEMLIKVLDGCGWNDHYWVFSAGATAVEVTVHVTDTRTGDVWVGDPALGGPSGAVTDTQAFATCP